ncbi:protein FATTY ACID EXPORT 5-like, partial [Salvia splendens]|uniref:protein FATTY ACID EXPORT 5-like n=1 Tax=Salvia splendens TaxID=180675 RepID=UPI001C262F95
SATSRLLLVLAGYLSLQTFHKRKNSYFALILETGMPYASFVAHYKCYHNFDGLRNKFVYCCHFVCDMCRIAMAVFYLYKIATGRNHIPPKTSYTQKSIYDV